MLNKNVADWSCSDVTHWLEDTGHEQYVSVFQEHDIDGKALLALKEDDNIQPTQKPKIGPYKRLFISIKKLQRENLGLLFELGQIDLYPSSHFYTQQKNEASFNKEFINLSHTLFVYFLS